MIMLVLVCWNVRMHKHTFEVVTDDNTHKDNLVLGRLEVQTVLVCNGWSSAHDGPCDQIGRFELLDYTTC